MGKIDGHKAALDANESKVDDLDKQLKDRELELEEEQEVHRRKNEDRKIQKD